MWFVLIVLKILLQTSYISSDALSQAPINIVKCCNSTIKPRHNDRLLSIKCYSVSCAIRTKSSCRRGVNSFNSIVYKHWPDTRELITRTVELWNRWIRLSCYYNRVKNTCPLYTHLHLFCNALVHVIYSVVSGQYLYTIPLAKTSISIALVNSYSFGFGNHRKVVIAFE